MPGNILIRNCVKIDKKGVFVMKKNKMMRLASAMMVLTLMSTSVISGTFAKYVTSDSATDTARVAKWGVEVTASGTLFAETYKKTVNTPGDGNASVSVKSNGAAGDNVVAPGTQNDEGITFAITGTPEVDVQVDVDVDDSIARIFLASTNGAETLPDMTTGDDTDYFATGEYEPVKYTLWQNKCAGFVVVTDTDDNLVENVGIATLEEALEGISGAYSANDNLAKEVGTLKITWKWDFDDNNAGTYDKQDTLLGALAANTTLVPAPNPALVDGTDYNLTTGLTLTVSVTQID